MLGHWRSLGKLVVTPVRRVKDRTNLSALCVLCCSSLFLVFFPEDFPAEMVADRGRDTRIAVLVGKYAGQVPKRGEKCRRILALSRLPFHLVALNTNYTRVFITCVFVCMCVCVHR